MRATQVLLEKGVSIQHLHVSTLKPFSDPTVKEAISKATAGVITMENHNVIGGLGTAVSEVNGRNGCRRAVGAHGHSRHLRPRRNSPLLDEKISARRDQLGASS